MSTAKKATTRTIAGTTALSPRMTELHIDTNEPEPYAITDTIVVTPPGRIRRQALKDAELKKFFAQQVLSRRAAATVVSQPPQLAADATDEQIAEYDAALKEWTASFDIVSIQQQIAEADEAYERAFFGDAYDAVIEFFETRPRLWEKFIPDIQAEFLPQTPQVGSDEDAEGKALESSTSSKTTGT